MKGLGGKAKLTGSVIDKLQHYYGIAVRSNSGNLQKMKTSIAAALFHAASSVDHNWHDHCPLEKIAGVNITQIRQMDHHFINQVLDYQNKLSFM